MSSRVPGELAPGTRIGKYEIVRLLGQGGMGAVYEAMHPELKKRVAIKTLHPELAKKPMARTRFIREGQAASRIRHPHVVDVTDVDTHQDMPYMVMEFLDGLDLKAHIRLNGALGPREAVELMLPVLAAVAAGHDEGVIHRDLKPHNILLARDRNGDVQPKVLDFGVSKLLDAAPDGASLTGTTAIMGTVAYMSPEQARGAKFVDARSDQYSLGLILFECLTARRAHEGDNTLAMLRQISDGQMVSVSLEGAQIYEPLIPILKQALTLEPPRRFPSLYHFGRALLVFASERSQSMWRATFEREPSAAALNASIVFESVGIEETAAPAAPPAATPVGSLGTQATAAIEPTLGYEAGRAARGAGRAPSNDRMQSTLGQSAVEQPAVPAATTQAPVSKSRTGVWIALTVVALGGAAAVFMLRGTTTVSPPISSAPAPAPAPRMLKIAVKVEPPDADIALDGETVGRGAFSRELTADGRSHTLRITAAGFETQSLSFLDAPPPEIIRLQPVARPAVKSHPKPAPAPPAAAKPVPGVGANQAPIIKE